MLSNQGHAYKSLVLQAMALMIFSIGFFQWSPFTGQKSNNETLLSLKSQSQYEKQTTSSASSFSHGIEKREQREEEDKPIFDKMIFMVIDALRADFVYDKDRFGPKGFPWLHSQRGNLKKYIALAQAPTVTLPRLKALTFGIAPRFLDLISNLSEENNKTDEEERVEVNASWPSQTSVLHYGDNTWMRLFPGLPGEGTHSFLVTDTIEVDRNVTRNLDSALDRDDWNVLTLHYLGLDHVGHVGGITSPLLFPKMQEMDGIVKKLYEALAERDRVNDTKSLLVVLGDHGMTDGGNHGGSSKDEIETACIFLSPHYNNLDKKVMEIDDDDDDDNNNSMIETINQVDVASTISLLLGLKIPIYSIGQFIASSLPTFVTDKEEITKLFLKNAIQLSKHKRLQSKDISTLKTQSEYEEFNRKASKELGGDTGEYNMLQLLMGMTLMFMGFIMTFERKRAGFRDWIIIVVGGGLTLASIAIKNWSWSSNIDLFTLIVLLTFTIFLLFDLMWVRGVKDIDIAASVVCGAYAISQFSSSFIEEEHFFWNFALTTLLLIRAWNRNDDITLIGKDIGLAILYRLIYYWNSTGFLYQNDPDVKRLLISHPTIQTTLWIIAMTGVILFWCIKDQRAKWYQHLIFFLSTSGSIVYRFTCNSVEREMVLLGEKVLISLFIIGIVIARFDALRLVLFKAIALLTILKPHNAIPLLIFTILSISQSYESSSILNLVLLHASYFLLGPCHIIASIDFSPAYFAHSSFNAPTLMALGYFVIWAGPFLVTLNNKTRLPFYAMRFRAIAGLAVLISLAMQRHHISVWTVFAPRLLFEFGWYTFYLLNTIIIK